MSRRAESIAATAVGNGNFKTLVAALKKADLVSVLSGAEAFTVFAPTDDAFAALLKQLGVTAQELLDRPDLKSILLYHVVPGTAMSSSLKNGQAVPTVHGGKVSVAIGANGVKISGATVTTADIVCNNGVIHVIDRVLLPKFDPAAQVGVTMPLGYFDPLGLGAQVDEGGFKNYQASEIKHGRVAMMASVGLVFQHFVKFPGFDQVPDGWKALFYAPGIYGFGALTLLSGALELTAWSQKANKEPGNFGDPFGVNQYNKEMREKEINNGRMAMLATVGLLVAEFNTGKDSMQQLGLS